MFGLKWTSNKVWWIMKFDSLRILQDKFLWTPRSWLYWLIRLSLSENLNLRSFHRCLFMILREFILAWENLMTWVLREFLIRSPKKCRLCWKPMRRKNWRKMLIFHKKKSKQETFLKNYPFLLKIKRLRS